LTAELIIADLRINSPIHRDMTYDSINTLLFLHVVYFSRRLLLIRGNIAIINNLQNPTQITQTTTTTNGEHHT